MRKKFLGEAFWIRKMHMFNETRGNIIKSADGSANKAVSILRELFSEREYPRSNLSAISSEFCVGSCPVLLQGLASLEICDNTSLEVRSGAMISFQPLLRHPHHTLYASTGCTLHLHRMHSTPEGVCTYYLHSNVLSLRSSVWMCHF